MEQFDVFLAHNSQDKPQVRAIAQKLKQQQLRPWLDEEQILGGDTILEKVYGGITQSRTGAFFISRNGLGNFQENIELYTVINWFLRQQGKSQSFRVIPILLPGVTNIPDKIAHLAIWRWIQFSNLNDEFALQDLIRSIKVSDTPFEIPPINPLPRRKFLKWAGWGSLGLVTTVVGREIFKLNQPSVEVPNEAVPIATPSIEVTPAATPTATPEIEATSPTIPRREDTNLESEIGINYTKLRNLLEAGNWKEADRETSEVMDKALNGTWSSERILNFPCTDLRTIDRLWVEYSNGHFGFSVQKEIYLGVGGKADGNYYEEAWRKFGDRVGWRVNRSWIDYSDVIFDTSSPKGHLPILVHVVMWEEIMIWGLRGTISSLASRLVNCNI